jgi:hypothetical protein
MNPDSILDGPTFQPFLHPDEPAVRIRLGVRRARLLLKSDLEIPDFRLSANLRRDQSGMTNGVNFHRARHCGNSCRAEASKLAQAAKTSEPEEIQKASRPERARAHTGSGGKAL